MHTEVHTHIGTHTHTHIPCMHLHKTCIDLLNKFIADDFDVSHHIRSSFANLASSSFQESFSMVESLHTLTLEIQQEIRRHVTAQHGNLLEQTKYVVGIEQRLFRCMDRVRNLENSVNRYGTQICMSTHIYTHTSIHL